MYKLMAGGLLFLCSLLNNYGGRTEITLGDFMWVIAIALMGAGLDTIESKKK